MLYRRVLNFNWKNSLIQEWWNFVFLFFIKILWKKNIFKLLIAALVSDVKKINLFCKLNWQELLLFSFELGEKCLLIWHFRDKFDKKVYINLTLTLYNFNKFTNHSNLKLFTLHRFFSIMPKKLRNKLNKKIQQFENIFCFVNRIVNFQKAWCEIKYQSKNSFLNKNYLQILKNISRTWFIKTFNILNSGFYKYQSFEKIYINKKYQKIKQFVAISNPCDKIIHTGIFRVLEQIYGGVDFWELIDYKIFDNSTNLNWSLYNLSTKLIKLKKKTYEVQRWILKSLFNHNSFGFKFNTSVHSVIRRIKRCCLPVSWFWSINFKNFLNKINCSKLIKEIERKINDSKLIEEIWKIFQVNKINVNKIITSFFTSVFYFENFFLFFLNIYLLSLDNYINELKWKLTLKYFKHMGLSNLKRSYSKHSKAPIVLNQTMNFFYVRYVNNLLFGFYMNKILVKNIIHVVYRAIKCKLFFSRLKLNLKTKLVHAISEWIIFLNFKIGLVFAKRNHRSKKCVRFNKFKTNLERKKILEEEKYLKIQEQMFSKLHKKVIQSIAKVSKALTKKNYIKFNYNSRISVKIIRSLKNSLAQMETELLFNPLVESNPRYLKFNSNSKAIFQKWKKVNSLEYITKKWIQEAYSIANKETFCELQMMVGKKLSLNFIKAREAYLKELDLVFSKNFYQEVEKTNTYLSKTNEVKHKIFLQSSFNYYSIRILFPKNFFVKKLKFFNILDKFAKLTFFKDYQIINWYVSKVNGIWNYYSCSDNIWEVKKILNWLLRYSLLRTLAIKHKFSIKKCIQMYSMSPCSFYVYKQDGLIKSIILAKYPSFTFINNKKKKFTNNPLVSKKFEKMLQIKS